MARRNTRYRRSRSESRPSWLVTGLLMGLSVIVVMNWEVIRSYVTVMLNPAETSIASHTKPVSKNPSKKQPVQSQSPEFDFYNMLGNQKTQTTAEKPRVSPKALTAETQPIPVEHYVIQIASLPSHQEADRLKAELTMMGFDISVQPYQHDNKTWYRVNAGPYASKAAALAGQAELQQNQVIGVLVKQ